MPMRDESDYGTNDDSTVNSDYCCYCYDNGEFTEPDMTLEEMSDKVRDMMINDQNMPETDVSNFINKQLPNLKRWQ